MRNLLALYIKAIFLEWPTSLYIKAIFLEWPIMTSFFVHWDFHILPGSEIASFVTEFAINPACLWEWLDLCFMEVHTGDKQSAPIIKM